MHLMFEITSPQNARIKRIGKLRTARGRRQHERILIEGARELRRALDAGVVVDELYCLAGATERTDLSEDVAACLAVMQSEEREGAVISTTQSVWNKIAVRGDDVQLLGVAQRPKIDLESLTLPENPLLLVIESVEKPGNLGAMFRTADGAGVDAVVLAEPQCDWLNPNAIRSSLGAVFSVPTLGASNEALAEFLERRGIAALAAIVTGEQELWSADCTGPTAVVMGSEANGLSPFWRERATPVRLPMRGQVDSLNVSAAAAVMLYEVVRQRNATRA